MKLQHGLFLVFFSFFTISNAQEQQPLPKNLTNAEKALISEFQFRSPQFTLPPASAVRTSAEWEEVEYLVISWISNYKGILSQIVAAAINECKVIITTQNESSVANYLTGKGIPLDNVIFMDAPANSIWIRDYAGNTVYTDDVGDRALVDWIYNRPRPLDNLMPIEHAALIGVPLYSTNSGTNDLVNTGGNFMSDGMGNAFASKLILDENSAGNPYGVSVKTEAQIDAIMQEYMGINRFIKMENLPYDNIHHIDMHMKLLDEETILVSRYPQGVADGPQIEENINYVLDNFQSPFGTPYKIKWIDAPSSPNGQYPDGNGAYRTYANAVFVNKTIIIPSYREEVDTVAIAQLEKWLPGYTIVPVDVDNSNEPLINSSGAIHCITNTIGVSDPMWIVHQSITEVSAGDSVPVNAYIRHNSGINQAKVFYRALGTTTYAEASMSLTIDDNWVAKVFAPEDGTDVEYYVWAEANSGKEQTRPIVAPEGYWTMDNSAPVLSVTNFEIDKISEPFPNPSTGDVSFKFDNLKGNVRISVHTILGQKLYDTTVESPNGVYTLSLAPELKGTLFVTFESGKSVTNKKIIKL